MLPKEELPPPYSVEKLDKTVHDRSGFSCDIEGLEQYLKRYARQDLVRGLATPYVLTEADEPDIIGYYTLSNHSVNVDALPKKAVKGFHHDQVPATLLGRLVLIKITRERCWEKRLLTPERPRS